MKELRKKLAYYGFGSYLNNNNLYVLFINRNKTEFIKIKSNLFKKKTTENSILFVKSLLPDYITKKHFN